MSNVVEEVNNGNAGDVATQEKKKKNFFIFYAVIIGIIAACVFLGPIVFIILGTQQDVGQNGKFINPMEREYILSVCIVTLVVCGLLFCLVLASLIWKLIHKAKKEV